MAGWEWQQDCERRQYDAEMDLLREDLGFAEWLDRLEDKEHSDEAYERWAAEWEYFLCLELTGR